jgi:putative ABC transport system permease protein
MPNANHPMFRRLVRRLLFANRGRLFVVLLALSAGAAVSAALLNLQTDAKRRINSEFRAFGANIIIRPRSSSEGSGFLDESFLARIPQSSAAGEVSKVAFLYAVVGVSPYSYDPSKKIAVGRAQAVLVGYDHSGPGARQILPPALLDLEQTLKSRRGSSTIVFMPAPPCFIGDNIASTLKLRPRDAVMIDVGPPSFSASAYRLPPSGGPEDNQVFCPLGIAQMFQHQKAQISLVQLSVPGTPQQIQQYSSNLQSQLPDTDVRPLRQFTEAQSKIYYRISGLLTAATAIILILTALCVMAAMTNIAAERKQDVGMMKAIGGSARSILNLFLTEAALLGLIGGLVGAAAGIALSVALGKAVFDVAAAPRLVVYPIAVSLTVIVAILGAYPLRRLANVRPATIFRGEA